MENPYEPQPASGEVLADFELNLVQASAGKRLANWLIDFICFYILSFLYGMSLPLLFHDGLLDANGKLDIKFKLFVYVIYVLYYVVLESASGGKTVGKWITGTGTVQEDGRPITPKIAFLRALIRIVPFEPFSALGSPSHPWHDGWTRTYVIDEKASTLPPEG
jgi:uncharacterized RDD family membrane protein YckC